MESSEHRRHHDRAQGPRVYDETRAEELRDSGLSQRQIARVLGQSRSQAQALLSTRSPASSGRHGALDREMSIEAGMAYLTRYDQLPTSVLWNATKAYERSPETWFRYVVGWASVSDPESWRKWPHPSAIAQTFASGMREFQRVVQREYAALVSAGEPYLAVPVPPGRDAMAKSQAVMRSWAGPNKEDRRSRWVGSGEVDSEPAPQPAILRPVAVAHTDDGPAAIPPCDERGTLGIVGRQGAGKTSALWRVALNDVLDTRAKVIVLERAEATVAGMLESTLKAPLRDDLSTLGGRTLAGSYDVSPSVIATDDASARARALMFIATSARRDKTGPVSLICDDGQDLLPLLVRLVAPCPLGLYLSVAWTPLGTADDVAMIERSGSLMAFGQDFMGIAIAVSDEMNRRNETGVAAFGG
jgi:hypothetical protein